MSIQWTKECGKVVPVDEGWNFSARRGFTAEELEAGLKELREKPVFEGVKGFRFQMREGALRWSRDGCGWIALGNYAPADSIFLPGNLRAMADAKES